MKIERERQERQDAGTRRYTDLRPSIIIRLTDKPAGIGKGTCKNRTANLLPRVKEEADGVKREDLPKKPKVKQTRSVKNGKWYFLLPRKVILTPFIYGNKIRSRTGTIRNARVFSGARGETRAFSFVWVSSDFPSQRSIRDLLQINDR